jgi:hypothetical protein
MLRSLCLILTWMLAASLAEAAIKVHVVSFGKWQAVQWLAGSAEEKPVTLKLRPLYVDGKFREYTLGQPHDITERLFVIQRAIRLNDALPGESPSPQLWRWERGGWVLVDRSSGRVSPVNLTEFDPFYSIASWYRDYAAYCGVSDDGRMVRLTVIQLGRRKPLLHKPQDNVELGDKPGSACPAPAWFRGPTRVEFQVSGGQKVTFSPRQRVTDIETAEDNYETTDPD